MKCIMLSIRPKWVEKIASGKKTIEVRKTRPKIETPFKCYIYCTKPSKKYQTICGCMVINTDELYRLPNGKIKHDWAGELMCCNSEYNRDNFLNGKVIGEFICDKVDKIMTLQHTYYNFLGVPLARITEYGIWNDDLPQMCLTKKEIEEYGKGKTLYGWHISDLKIYDKPRELSEFSRPCSYSGLCFSCKRTSFKKDGNLLCNTKITRPPQSWMYVEDLGEEK